MKKILWISVLLIKTIIAAEQDIQSSEYLEVGEIVKSAYKEVEEANPDYLRLVVDIQELRDSYALLMDEGMDPEIYYLQLWVMSLLKEMIYKIEVEPKIEELDLMNVVSRKMEGIEPDRVKRMLEMMGFL